MKKINKFYINPKFIDYKQIKIDEPNLNKSEIFTDEEKDMFFHPMFDESFFNQKKRVKKRNKGE